MKTVSEILDAVQSNSDVTKDELIYTLLAIHALHIFDQQAIRKLKKSSRFDTPERAWNESWTRSKACYEMDAQKYIGWNNDPKNPDYQKARQCMLGIAKKMLAKIEEEDAEKE